MTAKVPRLGMRQTRAGFSPLNFDGPDNSCASLRMLAELVRVGRATTDVTYHQDNSNGEHFTIVVTRRPQERTRE